MITADTPIWYASYGSNILEERFLCYIRGGRPEGSQKVYAGCRDQTLPADKEEIYINSQLYFAKNSKSWKGGGVCFISNDFSPNIQTLGRMYLITAQQFVEVFEQETDSKSMKIDFNEVRRHGSLIVKDPSWYGNFIYLGDQYQSPIFTFTNRQNLTDFTRPDETYLKIIIRGIQETYGLGTQEIIDYFINTPGIVNNYSSPDLKALIET